LNLTGVATPRLDGSAAALRRRDGLILLGLWLLSLLVDLVWVYKHQLPPAWDQGDHLSRALGFWRVLQHPNVLDGSWWVELWNQSPSYRGPLTYLVTAPVFDLLGPSYRAAILANGLFQGLLLVSLHGLGRLGGGRAAGLWAAFFACVAPALLNQRSDYLIDFSLTAVLTAAWWLLSWRVLIWRALTHPKRRWLWDGACGLALGAVVLTRPTGLLLLWLPLLLLVLRALGRLGSGRGASRWRPLAEVGVALGGAILVAGPWFSQNWLTILSTLNKARQWGVSYQEGLGADTLAGWLFYPRLLPAMAGASLVGLVAAGAVVHGVAAWRRDGRPRALGRLRGPLGWWLSFPAGGLLLATLMTSKDFRFVLPLLPQLLLGMGVLTARVRGPWVRPWQGALVAIGIAGLLSSQFDLGADLTGFPGHPPRPGGLWPQEAIIGRIRAHSPHQLSTLAVLPDSEFLNAFNLEAEGRRQNFRVAARQTVAAKELVGQDLAGFDWFLLKGGNQGVMSDERQARLSTLVSASTAFQPVQGWALPDRSEARLYRRRQLSLTVAQSPCPDAGGLRLETDLTTAGPLHPGQRLPLTTAVRGPAADLAQGMLLLSWKPVSGEGTGWRHDHGVGQGMVRPPAGAACLEVHERLALTVPERLEPGSYRLEALLLRPDGSHRKLPTDPTPVQVTAANGKPPLPAGRGSDLNDLIPPNRVDLLLDLGQQLRRGELDALFARVGQINQTDPDQIYLEQGERILQARLTQESGNLADLYALALAQALQRHADASARTLEEIVRLDPGNPHALLGLGFVELYRFRPASAQPLLERAAQLDPGNPTLRTLRIVASAMGLDLPRTLKLLNG
jgi:4-amino-4-deoxy-L-arabinose transferase-like glycosyltransferase